MQMVHLGKHMSKSYSKIYRNLTKTILDKIVSPQVLGNTAELEQNISHETNTKVCYVLEDASLSNTVLIDKEAIQRGLPSVFSKIEFDSLHEDDSMLVLNENNASQEDYHYSAKLLRLIENLEKNPQYDIQLVPVTVLWGRSPQYENSWVKALFADAWSKPNKIKQTLNISLYGRENYIEFHKPLSLRELFNQANYANQDSLKWIEKEWKKEKSIADITYQKDLIKTVNDNIRRISIVLLILVAVFLLISISLINNTIRLGVYSQRFKMHTMKLVGASYGFIRRPYMWRMLLVGLISSVFACIILGCGIYALFSFEPEIKEIISVELMIILAATVFVLGFVISLVCGFFSVNKFLRMKASDLYKI